MNKKAAFPLILCLFAVLACLVSGTPSMKSPPGASSENIPLYSNSITISVGETDISRIITDILGYDYLLFASNTNISWTSDLGTDVMNQFDRNLPESKWRLQSDWLRMGNFFKSQWMKGDLELITVVFDNLDSENISDFNRQYGISGPTPGSTLILVHVIDKTQPLPNATTTAAAEHRQSTATAQAQSDSATATAAYWEWQANATKAASTAIAQATQQARTTATAFTLLQQQLQAYSDEFNTESLSENWVIYRVDETKWDLSSQPGFLHIIGRPESEAGLINIFGVRVSYSDLEVVTRIETNNMVYDGQSIWIAFTPNQYSSEPQPFWGGYYIPGHTVEIGIAFNENDGPVAYMWECSYDLCGSYVETATSLGRASINFQGSIYLKLTRMGETYTGYYSNDGVKWSYLGEVRNFTIIDQVILGAGGGKTEFDAYFDYIKFGLPNSK